MALLFLMCLTAASSLAGLDVSVSARPEASLDCWVADQTSALVQIDCTIKNNFDSEVFIYGGSPNLEGPEFKGPTVFSAAEADMVEGYSYVRVRTGGDRYENILQYMPGKMADLDSDTMHEGVKYLPPGGLDKLTSVFPGESIELSVVWGIDIPISEFKEATWKVRLVMMFLEREGLNLEAIGSRCKNRIHRAISSSKAKGKLRLNAGRQPRQREGQSGNYKCRKLFSENFDFLYSQHLIFHWKE